MLKFDEVMLVTRLYSLPNVLRVVFAASCAERLFYGCRVLSGEGWDLSSLKRALAGLWAEPEARNTVEAMEAEIEQVMAAIPQEDELEGDWTQDTTNAQNAGMAVAYALRARLTCDIQEAAWAARVAYEALDNFVINAQGIDINAPGGEARVLSEILVQSELARQQADLAELERTPLVAREVVIDRIHKRATADAALFYLARTPAIPS